MFFLSDQKSFLLRINKQVIFTVLVFSIPLLCLAESLVFSNQESISHSQSKQAMLIAQNNSQKSTGSTGVVRRGRVPVRKTGSIKPQYESCKGKDIYKLNSEFQDKSHLGVTEAIGSCIECAMNSASASNTDDSLEDIQQALETENRNRNISRNRTEKTKTKKSSYQAFKDQLRKRVLGQVKTKMAQTQILQKCTEEGNIEKHRGWLTKRFPKVDWPLMKALCEKKKEDFHSSMKQRWSDMRISRALMSANPDQSETGRPNLSFPLSHEVSDFSSMSKLTKEEQLKAKERWAEHLSKVPLDKLSPEQLKSQFLEGKPLRKASTKDLQEVRRATWELNKQSQARYRKHIEEMPLMGYMKTGDPENEQDMDQAFSKYMGHLDDLLKKVEDKNVDMALLLSFGPLVEGLLKDNEGYCLAAEGARLKSERDESLKMWGLVAAGVVAAVPCFMTAGAVCLGLGVLVGAIGYKEAKGVAKETLERFLTGREFETVASLSEKDSAAFWELMLLPLAAWGTTAGTALTIKNLFKKGASAQGKKSASAGDDIARASTRSGSTASSTPTGIESYQDTLGRLTKASLGTDNLSPQQMKALENYYSVVRGEMGKDGTFARAGNYTVGQTRRIIRFLEKEFSPKQVRTLIEDGVVEINRIDPKVNKRKVLKSLSEGKAVFINNTYVNQTGPYSHTVKIRKILEKMNNGLLVETERIDPESGQLLKEKRFVSTKKDYDNDIAKISEKTDSGFVIDMKNGDNVFFSFEKAIENSLLPKNPTVQDYLELEKKLMANLSSDGYSFKDSRIKESLITEEPFRFLNSSLRNPEMEAVFLAAKSNRRKINSSDLNLPPSTNMEPQLAEQSYKANYTGGIDQVTEWAIVRKRLQELNANPQTTHIEYFADQIPDHIAHIRKGLEKNYSPSDVSHSSKLDQLKKLENLEKEAREATSEESVTYHWWLEFNAKLTRLMSGANVERNASEDDLLFRSALSDFPLRIIMPTTKAEQGIMALNRAGSEGVYPAGLVDQPNAKADGIEYSANGFFEHDIGHSVLSSNSNYSNYVAGHRLFYKRLLKNMENLPPEKRKKAEAIYFLMTHENQTGKNISYSDSTPQQVKEDIIDMIHDDVAGLFKFPDDPSEAQKKTEDLADTFMEVYNQALQHQ